MGDLVRHILTFVVLITVLKGLISNEDYRQYFNFFSGMVMIVLLCEPLLSFLSGDVNWYQLIEDAVIEENVKEKLEDIKLADGKMEEILKDSCRAAVEEQVHVIAEREGFEVGEVEVSLSQNDDVMEVSGIVLMVSDSEGVGEPAGDRGGKQTAGINGDKVEDREFGSDIEDIEIDRIAPVDGAVPVSETIGNAKRQQLTGKRASRLKNTLKDYYLLQEEAVEIWKY